MELLELENRIKVCSIVSKYKLSSTVTVISEDALLEQLNKCIEDYTLQDLAHMSSESQVNILSLEGYYDVFKALCRDINITDLDFLFCDVKNIDIMKSENVPEIINLQGSNKISKVCWHIYLKDRKNSDSEILLQKIKGYETIYEITDKVDEDFWHEIDNITGLEIVSDKKFLTHINNYMDFLSSMSKSEELTNLLSLIYCYNGFVTISTENAEQLKADVENISKLLPLVCSHMSEGRLYDFMAVWLENNQLLYDLQVLNGKITDDTNFAFVHDIVKYVAFCYGEAIDMKVQSFQIELLVYAISHKKKAFIRLIKNNYDLFNAIPGSSVLYSPIFFKSLINLNTLSVDNLKDLAGINAHTKCLDRMVGNSYTFKEFRLLYFTTDSIYDVYTQLDSKSVDYKIVVLNELVKHSSSIRTTDVSILPKFLNIKKLSDWYNQFNYIQDLSYPTLLMILRNYDSVLRFVQDAESDCEVQRICKNIDKYTEMSTLNEIRQSLLTTDDEWLELRVLLNFTDSFIEQNRETIIQFITRNGAHIMYRFLRTNKRFRESIKRLVTADILEKFSELKYHTGDLSKELSINISESIQNKWQSNFDIIKGDWHIWEEDKLLPIMQIGEIPTKTCISYLDGTYNECLLSNFDSNKKVIFVAKNNKIVFRAILRLTKGSSVDIGKTNTLEFADVTKSDFQQADSNQLILFLEKGYYCTINDKELHEIFEIIYGALKDKALGMNVPVVCSSSYESYQNNLIQAKYFVYISKSKAGEQYLDSLGGTASISDECRYVRTNILINESDLHYIN